MLIYEHGVAAADVSEVASGRHGAYGIDVIYISACLFFLIYLARACIKTGWACMA
jgi:hypothetical protein